LGVMSAVFVIGLGTLIFVILNRIFSISYFGCSAVTGLWLACVVAGVFLIEIVVNHLFISSIVFVVLLLIAFSRSKG